MQVSIFSWEFAVSISHYERIVLLVRHYDIQSLGGAIQ